MSNTRTLIQNSQFKYRDDDIAIIGLSFQFPGGNSIEDFRSFLVKAEPCVDGLPQSRLLLINPYLNRDPDTGYMKGAYLSNISEFDYTLFRISPKEAIHIHPAHRLFLQNAWLAIEDAGYGGKKLIGSNTGVFVGAKHEENSFGYQKMLFSSEGNDSVSTLLGNMPALLPSRVSYLLDLKGPAILVDTACSSSLVAVHMACQSLKNGECEYALAGGVRIDLFPTVDQAKIGIESSDGYTRAFDEQADGTGYGEGVGVVVLKKLSDAIKDRDRIYAIIKGSAINQDGRSLGITAPNPVAQAEVIKTAWRNAGIDPRTITYIEAHGTGTKLGDPIEVEGIRIAFEEFTSKKQFCAISSVKSNMGHLHEAAGIAGLIKAVLCLQQKKIPPSANYNMPNSKIPFINSPVYVNDRLADWNPDGIPRRCGVSSFGLSGTNAHVVMEEYDNFYEPSPLQYQFNILCLSAKSISALRRLANTYITFLKERRQEEIHDICFVQNTARNHLNYRVCFIFETISELITYIQNFIDNFRNSEMIFYGEDVKTDIKIDVKKQIIAIRDSHGSNINQWKYIAKKYAEGADIPWEMLYESGNKIHVPFYPFEKTQCWVDLNRIEPEAVSQITNVTPFPDQPDIQLTGKKPNSYTDTEMKLGNIFAKVLGFDHINIDMNFYEMGGDSISMMKIIAEIESLTGKKISVTEFHNWGTIRAISDGLDNKAEEVTATEEIENRSQLEFNVDQEIPLTEVQKAYFIGRDQSFELGGISTTVTLEIDSNLDIKRLNRAICSMIGRHEALRTVISPEGYQRVLENVPHYQVKIHDIRKWDVDEQAMFLQEKSEQMVALNFMPNEWPLFAIEAVQTSDDTFRLYFCFDMLIADGNSLQLFAKELMDIYEDPQLDLKPIRYKIKDYMKSLTDLKKGSRYKKDSEYWKNKVHSFPFSPRLPIKQFAIKAGEQCFNRIEKTFSSEDWAHIKRIAKSHGVTPSAILLTIYSYILAKWSNQQELSVSLTMFNRWPFHEDVNHMIGDFTSILPIDVKISGSFWDCVKQVQQTVIQALDHRSYDGVEMARELSQYWNMGTRAIFPVVFTSMLNEDSPGWDNWSRLGTVLKIAGKGSQVILDHQVTIVDGGISLGWDYVEQLFDKRVIQSMFNQYIHSIEKLLNDTDPYELTISGIAQEEYNKTTDELLIQRGPRLLHETLRQQVDKNPGAIAVVSGQKTITYEELDQLSNKFAHYLVSQGVVKGDRVGIAARRDIDTIVYVLGTLKAGCIFVPYDPTAPEEHKNYVKSNSGFHLQVDSQNSAPDIEIFPTTELVMNCSENDTAYIIYTSGSTGKPKGVKISHLSAMNTILDVNRKMLVNSEDAIAAISSLCFDLSIYDIFGALSAGAKIVIIPDPRDVNTIASIIEEQHVTIWNSVPALLSLFLEQSKSIKNDTVRCVLLSGDWIPLTLPEKAKETFSKARVFSLGGATEASIWSIYYPIDDVRQEWSSIPYGYPLANQQVYVLDFTMQPCPPNVEGELYIGGVGLAKSYYGNEEKTAESFINHPKFGRIYRTGDYGVFRGEGYIEFKGRKDGQVKVRGYRIELTGIESCLLEHPQVKQAVVTVVGNDQDQRLAAYFVPEENGDLNSEAVAEWSEIFNAYYKRTHMDGHAMNFSGWNSSYDGNPIPEDQMQEWLENTIRLIHRIRPKKVLEVGCGTGLIVNRIAPLTDLYYAMDISEEAISLLSTIHADILNKSLILEIREAKDFSGVPDENFDLVIINSVAQYFPNRNYFLEVIHSSVRALKGNGAILIGDVRDLSLLEEFHLSVILYRNQEKECSVSELKSKLAIAMMEEHELCVHPNFFYSLSNIYPNLSKVEILPKQMKATNELSKFRYDVILTFGEMKQPVRTVDKWVDLSQRTEGMSVREALVELLETSKSPIAVTNIPLERTAPDIESLKMLRQAADNITWKELIQQIEGHDGIDSIELIELAQKYGKSVQLIYCGDGLMRAIFDEIQFSCFYDFEPDDMEKEEKFFNTPASQVDSLALKLKKFCQSKLPEYMVPDYFLPINAIPLNANGKVDRSKLPLPKARVLNNRGESEELEELTELQIMIKDIWQSVLKVSGIRSTTDIYDLGASSITLVRIAALVNEKLGRDIPVRAFFEHRTLKKLSEYILTTWKMISICRNRSKYCNK